MSIATEATPLIPNRFKRRASISHAEFERQKPLLDLEGGAGGALSDNQHKLGTLNGVFLPTALNVLSILMFLRFGFIIGQMGILGSMLLLVMSYAINLLTTLSISAIATNGTVRGGGAYYMVSRSLGPEFGGSIGIIFYIGQVLNSALNVVGFIEPLMVNFNNNDGLILLILPSGYDFVSSTMLLLICTVVSLTGSNLVSKAGSILFVILLIATLSVPISTILVKPFSIPELDSFYSGPTWENLKTNLMPHLTKGAAGSQLLTKETFNDLFGIFFPATAGIFAGASMSGDLKNPSRAIPKGTLYGLVLTFICYASVIIAMGISIPRDLLYKDVQVIQTVNLSQVLILLGEFSTSLFSVIVGIVGAAKVLQAILRDSIIPGLSIFSKGTKDADDPILAIVFTWILCQICLFADINQIATFITMAFLMTFIITNLACFLLKIASLPNFRPSFRYFSSATAFLGGISCAIAMFIVDGLSACLIIIFLVFLFLMIHYVCPPKQWGDVSQSLIYHQVRKYLLRLRQDNVKYWRPQILLLVDNPRTSWNLMAFCNNLKKGGLYILGHVIVTDTFQDRYMEFKKQRNAWKKLRDMLNMKAFVQISLGPTLSWGVRNVYLGSGLGGMRPNITVLGFYDLTANNKTLRNKRKKSVVEFKGLPTDVCRNESKLTIQEWVHIVEDLLILESNVAVARGFDKLKLPTKKPLDVPFQSKEYIDLYPIQMSAQIVDDTGTKSALSTNFDTYSLILQLGAILTTVPEWKKTHKLRVVVFVEYEEDMIDERLRVASLLEVLRIKAEVLVLCLSSGAYPVYEYIINGKEMNGPNLKKLKKAMEKDEWLQKLIEIRDSNKKLNALDISLSNNINSKLLKKINKKARRYTLSNFQRMGVSFSMRTSRLLQSDINNTNYSESDSELDDTSTYNDDDSAYSDSDVSSIRSHQLYMRQKSSSSSVKSPYTPKSKPSTTSISKASRPNFSSVAMPKPQVVEDAVGDQPSIMFIKDTERDRTPAPSLKRHNSKMSEQQKVNFVKTPELIPVASGGSNASESSVMEDDDPISFNEISARAQHLILNDLMMKTSLQSGIIFTTLPTPMIGCHRSQSDSLDYIENLDLWCDGLPPVLLINSQTVTVTTAL